MPKCKLISLKIEIPHIDQKSLNQCYICGCNGGMTSYILSSNSYEL